jgi:hypothetical protein
MRAAVALIAAVFGTFIIDVGHATSFLSSLYLTVSHWTVP